ncbi:MAG: DUF1848 domain-containing protein, partial [Desulfobacterales bacterium]|nr:DUF1848 domain-containing protein [Desulfobacterales bacterium]
KIILSASRRTDIPAFYMPWFMDGIEAGQFEVVNPYNQKISNVPAGVTQVHAIVFWSKDFGPFLKGRYGEDLIARGYHLFFNFTVNTADRLLEPQVPPLPDRLDQMAALCRRFGPRVVNWRFDPLCFYATAQNGQADNLKDFERVAGTAACLGIRRCVTSFRDDYAKIRKRTATMSGFKFVEPPLAKKVSICLAMQRTLATHKISLQTCCEKEVLAALPAGSGVEKGRCISADLLMALFGGQISLKRDSGQRTAAGCGCHVSRDIGSYAWHPCWHNCLFCYANPVRDKAGYQE